MTPIYAAWLGTAGLGAARRGEARQGKARMKSIVKQYWVFTLEMVFFAVGTFTIWFNSPMYKDIKSSQRREIVEYLTGAYVFTPREQWGVGINDWQTRLMESWDVSEAEIKGVDLKEIR